jgi:hypothetical protein
MGTTLTGTKPKDTYDSLIKVTDNGPLSGTVKYLSDGLGNDSVLALSTSRIAIGSTIDSGELITAYGAAEAAIVFQNTNSGTGLGQGLYLGTLNAANYLWTYEDQDMIFGANNTERMRILATGGLTFNGDTAAANALDDYEEGTWTMGVAFGGASVGVTTSANTGSYTKIGRQVTVNGFLQLSSKGSSSGVATITGLPFTVGSSTANYSSVSLRFEYISFANQFQGFADINTTKIDLNEITILGVVSNLTDADFANNSNILISVTYFV